MKQLHARVTVKGQVTIPVEVRRLLGVSPRDKVAFIVDGDRVCLERTGSVVERTAGAFRTSLAPLTAAELREAAEQAIADDVQERIHQ